MLRLISLWLLVSISASTQNPPRHSELEPTVEVVTPDHVYATTTDSLTRLDFRNFQFHIFDADGKTINTAKLRDGKYERKSTYGFDSLDLDWVRFIGEQSHYAIVSLDCLSVGGSSSPFGVIQVFTLREKHPVVVQQISFNKRGCGTSSTLSTRPLLLTVKGVHGWEHCCPKTIDVVEFLWIGGSFKQKSYHFVPLPETC
jgi:hypothetical protein